jgi:hypothetical protein
LHLAAHDAELNQLKMLVEQLADKVNARGDTPAERLAAVEHRIDEVATHGVRLGTTETTRISANGIPNLSTSVVVPGGLPRAIPVSAIPKIHTER